MPVSSPFNAGSPLAQHISDLFILTFPILNDGTNMPVFAGNLNPEELNSLVDFLQSHRTP